jgi:hypothetical protein
MADLSKITALAGELAPLDAVDFVADAAKPEILAKYGLDRPVAAATLTFNDGSPSKTLLVGNVREGKAEAFARLSDAPFVFTVRQSLRDALEQPSLALRPLQVWQFAASDIAAMSVKRGNESYTLTKDATGWKLGAPFSGNASAQTVQPLLSAAATIRAERFEAHKADDLARYGLSKPALEIGLYTPTSARLALIGNPVAAGAKSRFAKLADEDAIFVVAESLVTAADRPAIDLLDRRLLSFDAGQAMEIRGTSADGDWLLKRAGDGWVLDSVRPAIPADRPTVEEVLRSLSGLEAIRFVEAGPRVGLGNYGLGRPQATVSVTVASAGGAPQVHSIAIGDRVREGEGYYARVDQSQAVAQIDGALVRRLIREDVDFANRDLLSFDPAQLVAIRRRGVEELELLKGQDGWTLAKPVIPNVDRSGIDELVDRLAHLRVSRIIALDATDMSRYGLDAPAAAVTLVARMADGSTTEKVIEIGRPVSVRYQEPEGARYVRLAGATTVGILAPAIANRLTGPSFTFRDRMVARFNEADRAILEHGPRRLVFARTDGVWRITEPISAEAEQAEMQDLVNALSRLRADELVAEHATDVKKYGLDVPEARWRLYSGDSEVLNLLVGKREADSGRHFAKLASGDLVFALDAALSGRLLAEYRKRALWASLDSAQIETLIYGVADKTIVLQKVDGAWQVSGRPDQPVNAATINDLLGTLSNLKAERFLVDKDADLRRYGLASPARTIVVRPRVGNPLTLYLGNFELGTKRAYGRIYDAARTDVFLLSAADTAKLMRELSELVAGRP